MTKIKIISGIIGTLLGFGIASIVARISKFYNLYFFLGFSFILMLILNQKIYEALRHFKKYKAKGVLESKW